MGTMLRAGCGASPTFRASRIRTLDLVRARQAVRGARVRWSLQPELVASNLRCVPLPEFLG